MSAENDVQDVKREFKRQSSSEKKAITSSWESFKEFAAKVLGGVKKILEIINLLMQLWDVLRRRS